MREYGFKLPSTKAKTPNSGQILCITTTDSIWGAQCKNTHKPAALAIWDMTKSKTINFRAICFWKMFIHSMRAFEWPLAELSRLNLILLILWEGCHQFSEAVRGEGRRADHNAKDCDELWHACYWPGGECCVNWWSVQRKVFFFLMGAHYYACILKYINTFTQNRLD